jgi:hypothetical protein
MVFKYADTGDSGSLIGGRGGVRFEVLEVQNDPAVAPAAIKHSSAQP